MRKPSLAARALAPQRGGCRGFTLVECLVAIAVLAIAGLAAFNLLDVGARGALEAEKRAAATALLRARLAALDVRCHPTDETVDLGDGYEADIRVTPTAAAGGASNPIGRVMDAEVTVRWGATPYARARLLKLAEHVE
jgi:prepilin-type N-terminal cleavage/methylation domain-containing protein